MDAADAARGGQVDVTMRRAAPGRQPTRQPSPRDRPDGRDLIVADGRRADFQLGHARVGQPLGDRQAVGRRKHNARRLLSIAQRRVDNPQTRVVGVGHDRCLAGWARRTAATRR